MPKDDIENVAEILRRLGAEREPAAIMAKQLLKRAEQMAKERSVSRIEALDYLLNVTLAGSGGRVFEGDPPGSGATKRD